MKRSSNGGRAHAVEIDSVNPDRQESPLRVRFGNAILKLVERRIPGGSRDRKIALTGVANGLATVVTAGTGLMSIGMAVPYLGPEQYGLWVSATSWIQMLGIADLGVGNSLVNEMARAYAHEDRELARESVSTSLLLTMIAGTLVALIAFTALFTADALGYKLFLGRGSSAWLLTIVIVIATAIDLPLGTPGRVYLALQEGHITALWTIAGSVLSLAGVYAGIHLHLPLVFIAGGALLGRSTAKLASFVMLMQTKPWLRPRLRSMSKSSARRLFNLGVWYFAANVGFMLESQILYIVGPMVVGLSGVGEAAIVHRVYATLLAVPMLVLAPLWPAYAEALHRLDYAWIKATLARTRLIGICATILASLAVTMAGPTVLGWWLRGKIVPGKLILASGGLWFAMRMWREIHTSFLNGAARLRGQGTYGILSVGLQAVLAFQFGTRFGAAGIFMGWFAGFMLVSGIFLLWDCRTGLTHHRVTNDAA